METDLNSQGAPAPTPPPAGGDTGVVYGTFLERFIAALIDGVILGVVGFVLGLIGSIALGDNGQALIQPLSSLLGWVYFVYMDVNKGATLGKSAMGLRVQNVNTGQNLNYVEAFLREVVGKFISAIVLLLGYLWMLWDDRKQTWHDKIGSSVVVKVKK